MRERDWAHLAIRLEEARDLLGLTQAEAALLAGVSERTVNAYESAPTGPARRRGGQALRRLARFYGWTPDSIARVLAGGDPIVMPTVDLPAPSFSPAERETFIRMLDVVGVELSDRERKRMIASLDGKAPRTF